MNRRATRSDALSGGDFAVSIVLHAIAEQRSFA